MHSWGLLIFFSPSFLDLVRPSLSRRSNELMVWTYSNYLIGPDWSWSSWLAADCSARHCHDIQALASVVNWLGHLRQVFKHQIRSTFDLPTFQTHQKIIRTTPSFGSGRVHRSRYQKDTDRVTKMRGQWTWNCGGRKVGTWNTTVRVISSLF